MGKRLDNAKSLYMEAIRDGNYVEAINRYSGDRYTQHSTPVKDGREGFIEFFTDFVKRNPIRDIEIVRGFEDGRYVFLHVVQTLNDGEFRYVTADIFDTDDHARMIEHWDLIAELDGDPRGERSEVSGPAEVADLEMTGANKSLVERYTSEVLIDGEVDRLDTYVSADLMQHNPAIADGASGFRRYATDTGLRYAQVHRLVGSGNFVVTLAEVEIEGTSHAVMDIYRLDAGRIVEHWDVAEEITPPHTWVNSGKF